MGKTAVIPDDKAQTGGFMDLHDEIEELMLATTDKWLKGQELPEDAILQTFVKFHKQVANFETREMLGTTPVKQLLKEK